jgi:hypothetical protein
MPDVLFACVHDAGRSQMVAGLVMLRSSTNFSASNPVQSFK